MIVLRDNTKRLLNDFSKQHCEILEKYSHKSLKKLLESGSDLLLMSPKLDNEDFYKLHLWDISDEHLCTNNLMGFIGLGNCTVRITSRFIKSEKESSGNDYFLHYMLQKVFLGQAINLDTGIDSKESLWEYYYYLFPYYLNRALKVGAYKEYVYRKYNDINMRGAIDIKRHIQTNIPFRGKIAYSRKEHSYNNGITQLIRHTIEYIRGNTIGESLLNNSMETRESVLQIEYLTPDYHPNKRQTVVKDCREKISNSYWQDYEELRKLCLKILTHEKLSFKDNEDRVSGILFDGAWLWEEYLATVLKGEDFTHPNNRKRTGTIYLAETNLPRYPDFYSKSKDMVLDAKYKFYPEKTSEGQREDIHQILAYMYALKSRKGVLVYPSLEKDMGQKYNLKGHGGKLIYQALKISSEASKYKEFCNQMQTNEKTFVEGVTEKGT